MDRRAAVTTEFLQDPWFKSVLGSRQALLISAGRPIDVAPGQRVYRLGDPAEGLYAVLKGEVRLISYPAEGLQTVSLQLGPGSWFGELSVLDGEPRPHDAIAHAPSSLLFIALHRFECAVRDDPDLIRDIARLLARRQRLAVRFAEHMAHQSLDVRIAKLLLSFRRSTGLSKRLDQDTFVALTQDSLAASVGASRQAVNRHLKAFEAQGLVKRQYGKLLILDAAALTRRAFPDE